MRRERGYCSIGWSPSNHPDSFKVTIMMIKMIIMMLFMMMIMMMIMMTRLGVNNVKPKVWLSTPYM